MIKTELYLHHTAQAQLCFPAASNIFALPGGNGIFTVTPTEHIIYYTLLRKVMCQMEALPPFAPTRKGAMPPSTVYIPPFLVIHPPAVSVEQKSVWDWCGISNFGKLHFPRDTALLNTLTISVMTILNKERHKISNALAIRKSRTIHTIK